MQIRLLGGVRAVDGAGEPIDVGPAKCQALVAALALSPRSAVSVARLVTMVWGEDPPRTADKTLQTYVTRLRKPLGDASIERVGAAYRLDIDPEAIDVVRFQRHLDRGDVEAALHEWTGLPFEGLDAEGLAPAAQTLIEQWLAATETHLARLVDTDPAAAVAPLTELTAAHPFRERLCALLMTALYRAGRQADALAAYRTTRHHLVESLGVEPGPDLRALEQQILDHDEQLAARPPAARAPATTVGVVDVDGATRAWAEHPHESAAALARYEQLVRTSAGDLDGRVISHRDSSFGAVFGRAADAASWAQHLQAAVRREPWPRGVELRIRIGLHSGETSERDDALTPLVNVAACLAAAGSAGQTLMTAATAGALAGSEPVHDLGAMVLAGVPGEQRIVQLGDGDHPPVRSADDRRRGNLPRRSARLIGRDDELRRIAEVLTRAPVVTLVGPGGIGKTRLATAAAQAMESDYDGGAWIIELTPVAATGDVARAAADVLGVNERPGRDLTGVVVAALRDRRALLVLDNCEHVIDGAAALVQAIVDDCPLVHVVATSRERLGLELERVVAVGPLDPGVHGTALFRERATALDPAFDGHAHRAAVEEICRRLDGVPLAIELAAARTRTIPPDDLLARLDHSLRLLTGGGRAGVEHHRTLRAAIEWSDDLLAPAEQTVFRRLSVFAGPFDLTAAEAVAADDDIDALAVDELVARLVDQSMVLVEPGPFGGRFRLLESMRQFGAEQLVADGADTAIAERHARWCVEQARRIHDLLAGPAEIEGVARLTELWPNLRAAVSGAIARRDAHLARSLVAPVAAEVLIRSQTEIADWAARILTVAEPDDEDMIVFALSLAARRAWRLQDRAWFEALVERYGEPDHPYVRHARALVYLDAASLLRWCPEVTAGLRREGDDHLAQLSDIGVSRSLLILGRFTEADELMAVLVDRYRRCGPPSLLSWLLTMQAYSAGAQGDAELAARLFDESVTIDVPPRTHSRNRPIESMSLMRRGERSRALVVLRADVDDLLENDDVYDMAGTAIACMSNLVALGRFSAAARVEGFLVRTGQINTPILRHVAAGAAEQVAAHEDRDVMAQRELGRALDGRGALQFMRQALDELLEMSVT